MPPPAYVCVEELDKESRPRGNSESNQKIQDDSWKGTPFSRVRAANVKRFHLIQLPKKQAAGKDQLYYLRDANKVSPPLAAPSLVVLAVRIVPIFVRPPFVPVLVEQLERLLSHGWFGQPVYLATDKTSSWLSS